MFCVASGRSGSGSLFDRFFGGRHVPRDRDAEYDFRLTRADPVPKGEGAKRKGAASNPEKAKRATPWRAAIALPAKPGSRSEPSRQGQRQRSPDATRQRQRFRELTKVPRATVAEFRAMSSDERRNRSAEYVRRVAAEYQDARARAPEMGARFDASEASSLKNIADSS
jgi:hypothetical protein